MGRPLTDLGLLPSSFNIANSSYSEEEFEPAEEPEDKPFLLTEERKGSTDPFERPPSTVGRASS